MPYLLNKILLPVTVPIRFVSLAAVLGCAPSAFAQQDVAQVIESSATEEQAQDEEISVSEKPDQEVEIPVTEEDDDSNLPFGLGWLETTQRASSNQVITLTEQVDRFFGVPRSDLEAAYSTLRVSLNSEWVEGNGADMTVRIRGRAYLPRINERLSLVFSEDQGEGSDIYNPDPTGAQPENTRVNLELNLKEKDNSRLDFRVGLRSSAKLRASVRYRLNTEISEDWTHRLSQQFQFIDGRGFGSITRSEFDHTLTDVSLIRFINDLAFEEEYVGALFNSQVEWIKRVDDQAAVSVYARLLAETNPSFIASYTTGFTFRQAIYENWLFAEIQPGYTWFRLNPSDGFEGQLSFVFRIEMAIGKLD